MTIGEQLRIEREKRGYSIDDVHQKTKIHPDALTRFENDNFTNSPGGGVYTKGFLKKYAEFLELNVQEILAEFSSLGVKTKPVEFSIGSQKKDDKGTDFRKFWLPIKRHQKDILKSISLIAIFLVTLFISFLAIRTAGDWVHDLSVKWKDHQQVRREGKIKSKDIAAQKKKTSADAAKKVTQSSVKQVSTKMEGSSVEPSLKANATSEVVESINDGFINSPARRNFPVINPKEKIVLKVQAITDVWMRISADTEVLFERILKANTSEEWLATTSFQVRFGRPEGAVLIVNGENIGKPGDGKVKAIVISHDGIKQV